MSRLSYVCHGCMDKILNWLWFFENRWVQDECFEPLNITKLIGVVLGKLWLGIKLKGLALREYFG